MNQETFKPKIGLALGGGGARGLAHIGLVDFSRPRRGLMEGSRVRQFLRELIGAECCLENARIPVALTAVDLPSGQLVVLRQGNLVEAALATMSVPGIFTPVCIQGEV